MGAKAGVWVHRLLAGMLAIVGLWVVSALPLPIPIRLGIVATTAVLLGVLAFHRLPAFDPLGRVRWRLAADPSGRKRCAITFDDGPSAGTAQVLDVLARAQATATFFVLTTNAVKYGDLVRRAAAEGHAIAIHGTTHQKLAGADEATIEREVTSAVAMLAALGVEPVPLYRTPHGLKSAAVFRVARRWGLDLWAWSRGVWDTDRPPAETIVRRATRGARSGMVLLLHDGRGDELSPDISQMVAALPDIISTLRERGFEFVKLPASIDCRR